MNIPGTIRVTGKGMIRLKPDTTVITMTLEGTDPDYAKTLERSAADTERIADALALCTVGYFVGLAEEQVLKLDTIVKILLLAIAFFARLAIRSWFSDMGLGEFAESLLSGGLVQGAVTLALGSIWFVLVSSRDRRV